MQNSTDLDIKQTVREAYAKIAKSEGPGCGCGCGDTAGGYLQDDLQAIPEGAHMGLGSGTPLTVAAVQEGETVLDLGSGGGVDCFLAAKQVGGNGKVIGVDMTPEMVARARKNAITGSYQNVEFRLGEIEHLPVADASVDVILSNCVINLSTDKTAAYGEAFRVLKPGGRLSISDVVMMADIPKTERDNLTLHASCVAGAEYMGQLKDVMEAVGFKQVHIEPKGHNRNVTTEWVPGSDIGDYAMSATIKAVKPASSGDHR